MKKLFLFIFFSYFLFFFLIPPFQTPDEPSHFETTYWVSRFTYPTVLNLSDKNAHPYGKNLEDLFAIGIGQPMRIPNFKVIQNSPFQTQESYSQQQTKRFIPKTTQAYNPPVYYIVGAFFLKMAQGIQQSLLTQFYATRLASALFYFATLFFAYKFLNIYFQKQRKLVHALLLFYALNPLFINSGVGINPDIALTCFTTLFLLLVAIFTQKKYFFKILSAIFLGLVAGVATLSKVSGIFLIPTFIVYAFYIRDNIKQWVRTTSAFLSIFILTQIPWEIFNISHYHQLLATVALGQQAKHPLTSLSHAFPAALFEFRHTFMHFAGFFGWNDVYPFPIVFTIYVIFFVGLLCIGIAGMIKEKKQLQPILLLSFLFLFLFFYALSLQRVLFYPQWGIQGRYLLPVFLPMVLFVYKGLEVILRKYTENTAYFLSYFAIFYYFFIIIFVLLPRYYV